MISKFFFFLLALTGTALTQDLGVPLSWRKFSNPRPRRSDRIMIAQKAIDAIMPQLSSGSAEFNGIGYWQSGNVWAVLANQDRIAGTTVNQEAVINTLNLAFTQHQNYDPYGYYNDDAMWWVQAAIYAYRAYKDPNMLSHAEAVWKDISKYVISAENASSGQLPGKSFGISGSCEHATMAGGVFWQKAPSEPSINSITTGQYVTISAYLAEITNNPEYTNAAILSAQWIKAHNINLVLDTVNAQDCSKSPPTMLFTYNSGMYIEGLSVLGAVTGDSSWTSLMINILNSAVKTNVWQGADGVITEGSTPSSNADNAGFKGIFIRGLHEAFERNPNNSDLKTLIHSYCDVQYNALLELAANGDTYSSAWLGPPQEFTTWGQLAALDVLTSNINTN